MFESLAAAVLNRFLGSYIANLETHQLEIALLNGHVALSNLQLRTDSLDALDIPLDVVSGALDRLELNIPWHSLKTEPVRLLIQDLYLTAAPALRQAYDASREQARADREKTARLLAWEASCTNPTSNVSKSESSFTAQLVTKIVDNIQFTINRVHIRFEQPMTVDGKSFSCGLYIKSVKGSSADAEWKEAITTGIGGIVRKILHLDGFCAYWISQSIFDVPDDVTGRDTSKVDESIYSLAKVPKDLINQSSEKLSDQNTKSNFSYDSKPPETDFIASLRNIDYLIRPVSGLAHLTLNKKGHDSGNSTLIEFIFDELSILTSATQYEELVWLLAEFNCSRRAIPYKHLRPSDIYSNPKSTIKYVFDCVLADITEARRRKSIDYAMSFSRIRKEYLSVCTDTNCSTSKDRLLNIESSLLVEDIIFLRTLAGEKCKKKGTNRPITDSVPAMNSLWSWLGFRSSDVLKENELHDLYETIEYRPDSPVNIDKPQSSLTLLPQLQISFSLKSGSFKFSRSSLLEIASLQFTNITCNYLSFYDAYKFNLNLQSFSVSQNVVSSHLSMYKELVRSRYSSGDGSSDGSSFAKFTVEGYTNDHFIRETKISVCLSPLIVIHNPLAFNEFQQILVNSRTMELFSAINSRQISKNKKPIESLHHPDIKRAILERRNVSINVKLQDTAIVFPTSNGIEHLEESISSKSVIVLDLGRVDLESIPNPTFDIQWNDVSAEQLKHYLYSRFRINTYGTAIYYEQDEASMCCNDTFYIPAHQLRDSLVPKSNSTFFSTESNDSIKNTESIEISQNRKTESEIKVGVEPEYPFINKSDYSQMNIIDEPCTHGDLPTPFVSPTDCSFDLSICIANNTFMPAVYLSGLIKDFVGAISDERLKRLMCVIYSLLGSKPIANVSITNELFQKIHGKHCKKLTSKINGGEENQNSQSNMDGDGENDVFFDAIESDFNPMVTFECDIIVQQGTIDILETIDSTNMCLLGTFMSECFKVNVKLSNLQDFITISSPIFSFTEYISDPLTPYNQCSQVLRKSLPPSAASIKNLDKKLFDTGSMLIAKRHNPGKRLHIYVESILLENPCLISEYDGATLRLNVAIEQVEFNLGLPALEKIVDFFMNKVMPVSVPPWSPNCYKHVNNQQIFDGIIDHSKLVVNVDIIDLEIKFIGTNVSLMVASGNLVISKNLDHGVYLEGLLSGISSQNHVVNLISMDPSAQFAFTLDSDDQGNTLLNLTMDPLQDSSSMLIEYIPEDLASLFRCIIGFSTIPSRIERSPKSNNIGDFMFQVHLCSTMISVDDSILIKYDSLSILNRYIYCEGVGTAPNYEHASMSHNTFQDLECQIFEKLNLESGEHIKSCTLKSHQGQYKDSEIIIKLKNLRVLETSGHVILQSDEIVIPIYFPTCREERPHVGPDCSIDFIVDFVNISMSREIFHQFLHALNHVSQTFGLITGAFTSSTSTTDCSKVAAGGSYRMRMGVVNGKWSFLRGSCMQTTHLKIKELQKDEVIIEMSLNNLLFELSTDSISGFRMEIITNSVHMAAVPFTHHQIIDILYVGDVEKYVNALNEVGARETFRRTSSVDESEAPSSPTKSVEQMINPNDSVFRYSMKTAVDYTVYKKEFALKNAIIHLRFDMINYLRNYFTSIFEPPSPVSEVYQSVFTFDLENTQLWLPSSLLDVNCETLVIKIGIFSHQEPCETRLIDLSVAVCKHKQPTMCSILIEKMCGGATSTSDLIAHQINKSSEPFSSHDQFHFEGGQSHLSDMNFRNSESVNQSIIQRTVNAFLEPVRAAISLRDLSLFKRLQNFYNRAIAEFPLCVQPGISTYPPPRSPYDKLLFTCILESFQILIIDDSSGKFNVPLMEILLQELSVEYQLLHDLYNMKNQVSISSAGYLLANSYNRIKSIWEPIMERWPFNISMMPNCPEEPDSLYTTLLTSASSLEFIGKQKFIERLININAKLSTLPHGILSTPRLYGGISPPLQFINYLDDSVFISLDEKDRKFIEIEPGEDRLCVHHYSRGKTGCLSIEIPGHEPIGGLQISRLGVFEIDLVHKLSGYSKKTSIFLEIEYFNGTRIVRFRERLMIFNETLVHDIIMAPTSFYCPKLHDLVKESFKSYNSDVNLEPGTIETESQNNPELIIDGQVDDGSSLNLLPPSKKKWRVKVGPGEMSCLPSFLSNHAEKELKTERETELAPNIDHGDQKLPKMYHKSDESSKAKNQSTTKVFIDGNWTDLDLWVDEPYMLKRLNPSFHLLVNPRYEQKCLDIAFTPALLFESFLPVGSLVQVSQGSLKNVVRLGAGEKAPVFSVDIMTEWCFSVAIPHYGLEPTGDCLISSLWKYQDSYHDDSYSSSLPSSPQAVNFHLQMLGISATKPSKKRKLRLPPLVSDDGKRISLRVSRFFGKNRELIISIGAHYVIVNQTPHVLHLLPLGDVKGPRISESGSVKIVGHSGRSLSIPPCLPNLPEISSIHEILMESGGGRWYKSPSSPSNSASSSPDNHKQDSHSSQDIPVAIYSHDTDERTRTKDVAKKNRVVFRFDDSQWSHPVSIDTVGVGFIVDCQSHLTSRWYNLCSSIESGQGRFRDTRIVKILPRYVILNESPYDIVITDGTSTTVFKPYQQQPLHFDPSRINSLILRLRRTSDDLSPIATAWSAPFGVEGTGDIYLRIDLGSKRPKSRTSLNSAFDNNFSPKLGFTANTTASNPLEISEKDSVKTLKNNSRSSARVHSSIKSTESTLQVESLESLKSDKSLKLDTKVDLREPVSRENDLHSGLRHTRDQSFEADIKLQAAGIVNTEEQLIFSNLDPSSLTSPTFVCSSEGSESIKLDSENYLNYDVAFDTNSHGMSVVTGTDHQGSLVKHSESNEPGPKKPFSRHEFSPKSIVSLSDKNANSYFSTADSKNNHQKYETSTWTSARTSQDLLLMGPRETAETWNGVNPIDSRDITYQSVEFGKLKNSLLRIKRTHKSPATLISLSFTSFWPFIIRNGSRFAITVQQALRSKNTSRNSDASNTDQVNPEMGKKNNHLPESSNDTDQDEKMFGNLPRYVCEPGRVLSYAWDLPMEQQRLLIFGIGGKSFTLDPQQIGRRYRIKIKLVDGIKHYVGLSIGADGPAVVLALSDSDRSGNDLPESVRGEMMDNFKKVDSPPDSKLALMEKIHLDNHQNFGKSFDTKKKVDNYPERGVHNGHNFNDSKIEKPSVTLRKNENGTFTDQPFDFIDHCVSEKSAVYSRSVHNDAEGKKGISRDNDSYSNVTSKTESQTVFDQNKLEDSSRYSPFSEASVSVIKVEETKMKKRHQKKNSDLGEISVTNSLTPPNLLTDSGGGESPEKFDSVIRVRLPSLGFSMVGSGLEEIVYIHLEDIDLRMCSSSSFHTFGLKIRWAQVDNQLLDWSYPIVLYPTDLPRWSGGSTEVSSPESQGKNHLIDEETTRNSSTSHTTGSSKSIKGKKKKDKSPVEDDTPFLSAASIISHGQDYGVTVVKCCSVLVQEFAIEMGAELVARLSSFIDFDAGGRGGNFNQHIVDIEDMQMPSYATNSGSSENQNDTIFFELLHLHPIKASITASVGGTTVDRLETTGFDGSLKVNGSDSSLAHPKRKEKKNVNQKNEEEEDDDEDEMYGSQTFLFDEGMMGNFSETPIRMNALVLENVRVRSSSLAKLLMEHYRTQIYSRWYNLLISNNILNGRFLFSTLSSGVYDLFYEPYRGLVSDRPADLGIGLAQGISSFGFKTLTGITGSFGMFSGSIGRGLSLLTLDRAYQHERRIDRARNKPRGVGSGLGLGFTQFARGILDGFTGVVTQPAKGLRSTGVRGFFKGVGLGVTGLLLKPLVGFTDIFTSSLEGARQAAAKGSIFGNETQDIEPIRPPRLIPEDLTLRPYDFNSALGQSLLVASLVSINRNILEIGRTEFYVAHLDVPVMSSFLIVSTRRIYLYSCDIGSSAEANVIKGRVIWKERRSQIFKIHMNPNGDLLIVIDPENPESECLPNRIIPGPLDLASVEKICSLLD